MVWSSGAVPSRVIECVRLTWSWEWCLIWCCDVRRLLCVEACPSRPASSQVSLCHVTSAYSIYRSIYSSKIVLYIYYSMWNGWLVNSCHFSWWFLARCHARNRSVHLAASWHCSQPFQPRLKPTRTCASGSHMQPGAREIGACFDPGGGV